MAFFMFYIENLSKGYVDFYVKHFNSDIEKKAFFNSNLTKEIKFLI